MGNKKNMQGKAIRCTPHIAYLWCVEFHKGIALSHLLLIIAFGHVETISPYISHAYCQGLTTLHSQANQAWSCDDNQSTTYTHQCHGSIFWTGARIACRTSPNADTHLADDLPHHARKLVILSQLPPLAGCPALQQDKMSCDASPTTGSDVPHKMVA